MRARRAADRYETRREGPRDARRRRRAAGWMLMLAGAASFACSESGAGGTGGSGGSLGIGGSAGAAGSGATAGDGSAGAATVTVSWDLTELGTGATGTTLTPLADVEVCLREHAEVPCATSDANGHVVLGGVPAHALGAVTATKPGYWPLVFPGEVAGEDMVDYPVTMIAESLAGVLFSMAGATYTAGTSSGILVGVDQAAPADGGADAGVALQKLAGATVTLSPASGVGPVYASAAGFPDPALSETSSGGIAAFLNVTAGEVELGIGPPLLDGSAMTCERPEGIGWPGADPTKIGTLVLPGYYTYGAYFFCH